MNEKSLGQITTLNWACNVGRMSIADMFPKFCFRNIFTGGIKGECQAVKYLKEITI